MTLTLYYCSIPIKYKTMFVWSADGNCGEGPASCEGCGMKIVDRFLMRVGASSWHEQCVTCSACGVPLSKSCYYRHNGLYCKNDYDRYVRHYKFYFRVYIPIILLCDIVCMCVCVYVHARLCIIIFKLN